MLLAMPAAADNSVVDNSVRQAWGMEDMVVMDTMVSSDIMDTLPNQIKLRTC